MLTKEQKARLRAEEVKVWGADSRMVDFCVNEAAEMIELPSGGIITVDKQKIETHFCFGESGYDYEDAQRAAAHARTSEEHFIRENMRYFAEWLKTINEQYQLFAEPCVMPDVALLLRAHPKNNRLLLLETMWWHEVLDALGGSARLSELPGTSIERFGNKYRFPTRDELDAIKAAYEQAAEEHKKKVERYLKRYGLNKVHAWTYWLDA